MTISDWQAERDLYRRVPARPAGGRRCMHPCPHPSFLHEIAQRPFDRRVGGVLFRRAGLLRLSGLLGSFALAFGHFKLLVKVRLSGGGPSLPGSGYSPWPLRATWTRRPWARGRKKTPSHPRPSEERRVGKECVSTW